MQDFGKDKSGHPVHLFTVKNSNGMEIRAINYGGILLSIRVPDKNGEFDDVVLGFDSLSGYLEDRSYFGAIIGRYANRIANAKFTLEGREYHLSANDGPNTLHGGRIGFGKVLWKAQPVETKEGAGISFAHESPDGDQGFPGNLHTEITYLLTGENEVVIDYKAQTDRPTPINLTNHSYFNLQGEGKGDILGHELTVYAAQFSPVDQFLIPTGELRSVCGTPFDFTEPTPVGARIGAHDEQLAIANGYDHYFVLDQNSDSLKLAARLFEPSSGRILEVYTTEPGVQFYSGNFLDGTTRGKQGHIYGKRAGFSLETQHFPYSPNHPNFPMTILRPGQFFTSRTIYKFSVHE